MDQKRAFKDPWKELSARRGNRQVRLEEIADSLSLEEHAVRAFKRELFARVEQLQRRR